jgi:hypothetical protein
MPVLVLAGKQREATDAKASSLAFNFGRQTKGSY